jgi:hypothetical protein
VVFGETETETDEADCTTKEADPDFVESPTNMALIVIDADIGTLAGAV